MDLLMPAVEPLPHMDALLDGHGTRGSSPLASRVGLRASGQHRRHGRARGPISTISHHGP